MTSPARLLVLGLDAADPALIARWTADGTMPHLRAFLERALQGTTRSLTGFMVGSTWPTWSTGVSPARHGFHYGYQLKSGTYDYFRPQDEGLLKHEPFWMPLSRAGARVAIVDVPLAPVTPGINGIQVVEWGGHDSLYGFQTQPPALRDDLSGRLGCHPLDHTCDAYRQTPEDYRVLGRQLVEGARTRSRLTRELLNEGGWDLFVQVFTEVHCAGHQCWHLHDPAHPSHNPEMARHTGNILRDVYAATDVSLGEVLADAGDARVMLFSCHGMRHWFGAHFLLPSILERLQVCALTRPKEPGLVKRASGRLRRMLGTQRPAPALPELGIEPERSRCFPVFNGLATGGIRLNLVGREPAGVLKRAEADAFCAQLSQWLLEIEDERTGRPFVKAVHRTRDLYQGEHLDDLPDLLVDWDDTVATGTSQLNEGAGARVTIRSDRIGMLTGQNEYGRTGEHRREGFVAVAGPGVTPGRMERVMDLQDFAPTIGAWLKQL